MQSKDDIETFYSKADPWAYKVNPEDIKRKIYLIGLSRLFMPDDGFKNLLDLGAGEGWITQGYPAYVKHGFEMSDAAAARFPENVTRVLSPEGKYDLVTATGIMYSHYDYKLFLDLIKKCASHIVMVSSIDAWEVKDVNLIGRLIFKAQFPYREYTQSVKVFDVST